MEARANVGPALNAEKLRYVTEHFHQLQGLTLVVSGAFILLPTMNDLVWDRLPVRGWVLTLIRAALIAAYVVAFRYFLNIWEYIPEYYRRRYGLVEPRKAGKWSKTESVGCLFGILLFLLSFLMYVFFGRQIGRYADSILADVQSMIPHPVTFLPVTMWFLYMCASFPRNPHQEDFYKMYFLASGMLAWAFATLYPMWHPDAMHPTLWKFLNDSWMGLSLIAWGLYDHLTLVRLMPRRIRNEEDDNAGI